MVDEEEYDDRYDFFDWVTEDDYYSELEENDTSDFDETETSEEVVPYEEAIPYYETEEIIRPNEPQIQEQQVPILIDRSYFPDKNGGGGGGSGKGESNQGEGNNQGKGQSPQNQEGNGEGSQSSQPTETSDSSNFDSGDPFGVFSAEEERTTIEDRGSQIVYVKKKNRLT